MKSRNIVIDNRDMIGDYLAVETNPIVRFRLAFLNALVSLEPDLDRVCQMFHVAISTAYVWIREWNQEGYDGIEHPFHVSDQPAGRPPRLNEVDLEKLRQFLAQRGCWTTKEVRELIVDHWGVRFSDSQVARILREKLKLHFGKPYPHDYRRPAEAEELLQSNLDSAHNHLNDKGIQKNEIALGFLDEASPQTTANTVRVWTTGYPEIIKNTTKLKSNTIGFYAIYGQSFEESLEDSTAASIAKSLDKVRAVNSDHKAMVIVLDNFRSHKAASVIEYAGAHDIELVFLPPYSPDLNPIEFIWKTIKRHISLEFVQSLTHLRQIISHVWDEVSGNMSFAKKWIDRFLLSLFPSGILCG